jgi:hypothetical protein
MTYRVLLGLRTKICITSAEIQDPAIGIDVELWHHVKLHAEVRCKTLMLLDMKHTPDLLVHSIADRLAKDKSTVVDVDQGDADALSVPRQDQKALCTKAGDSNVVWVNSGHVDIPTRLLEGQPTKQIPGIPTQHVNNEPQINDTTHASS